MTTATANILFTDVEGSTELRARLGEAAADKLFLDLERLLRRLVERHRGRVVKTAGDGVMAAFESASDAVHAAVVMQQAVSRRPDGVRFRVGLAAGDVSWEDDDCFGLPVVTAARPSSRPLRTFGGQLLLQGACAAVLRLAQQDHPHFGQGFVELSALVAKLRQLQARIDVAPVAPQGLSIRALRVVIQAHQGGDVRLDDAAAAGTDPPTLSSSAGARPARHVLWAADPYQPSSRD